MTSLSRKVQSSIIYRLSLHTPFDARYCCGIPQKHGRYCSVSGRRLCRICPKISGGYINVVGCISLSVCGIWTFKKRRFQAWASSILKNNPDRRAANLSTIHEHAREAWKIILPRKEAHSASIWKKTSIFSNIKWSQGAWSRQTEYTPNQRANLLKMVMLRLSGEQS